jgi:hypothetical protein
MCTCRLNQQKSLVYCCLGTGFGALVAQHGLGFADDHASGVAMVDVGEGRAWGIHKNKNYKTTGRSTGSIEYMH